MRAPRTDVSPAPGRQRQAHPQQVRDPRGHRLGRRRRHGPVGPARAEMAPEGGKAPSLTALLARFVLLALEGPSSAGVAAQRERRRDHLLRRREPRDRRGYGTGAPGAGAPPRPRALTVAQLDTALRELTVTARSGTMPPERLRGSTFTLNNYGGLGVDARPRSSTTPMWRSSASVGSSSARGWSTGRSWRAGSSRSRSRSTTACATAATLPAFLRRVTELIEHPPASVREGLTESAGFSISDGAYALRSAITDRPFGHE